ncbi:MAG: hypothetical protein WC554_09465 [Clostridia bacterium]|jgi:hypothetical protein
MLYKSSIRGMKVFGHKMSEMLGGADGYWSAMRWISVTTANLILLVWMIISIDKWELQPIPESVVTIFGIAVAGKWAQKINESKENIAGVNGTEIPPTDKPQLLNEDNK